jgi:hypothetical protein
LSSITIGHLWAFGLSAVFTAHAVVEDPAGRLFDTTPSKASQRYPFLRHEEEFEAIIAAGYSDLDFRVP